MRLDTLVFQRGLCESRTRAAAYIRDGRVTVDGAVIRKPSFDAPEDAAVTLDPTAPAPSPARSKSWTRRWCASRSTAPT